MTTVSRIPSVVLQDEIDFFHIFRILWQRRALILAVTLVVTAFGGGYAFFAIPVYEVSTVLRPAALNDLDAINRSKIYSLPRGRALVRVGAALESYETRLNFFLSKPELIQAYTNSGQTPDQAFTNFNEALILLQPDSKKEDLLSAFVGLKMRFEKGLDGATVLNDFVAYAIDSERVQLEKDFKAIVNNRLEEVAAELDSELKEYDVQKESKIARLTESDSIKKAELYDELKALRVQLRMRRDARLASLEEAITIARSLGLKKPATPSSMAEEVVGAGNIIRTEVNSQQVPLYFMGSDVLEAERNALRKRISDDFTEPRVAQIRKELLMLASNRQVEILRSRKNEVLFLEGIEALRAERIRLLNLKTDLEQLRLVNVDQFAVPPTKPISPHKGLIILVASIAGVCLGGILALLRGIFKARLRQDSMLKLKSEAVPLNIQQSAHV